MSNRVDLYNNAYANLEHDLYRQVRTQTYGRDLGQTSWVTTQESASIPTRLQLTRDSNVLEIGCGSGRYALHLAQTLGCHLTALDINPHAIATANQLAATLRLDELARFQQCDASQRLPFADGTFDAAFANDVICHIPQRPRLLQDLFRILRPGARLFFSDALVIGGMISHQDLATRSSIGPYFFSPPGENERLLAAAGFTLLSATDTSAQAAEVAERWHSARERRRRALTELEGPDRFEGLQLFLDCVHRLTAERRLLRILYLAEKPVPFERARSRICDNRSTHSSPSLHPEVPAMPDAPAPPALTIDVQPCTGGNAVILHCHGKLVVGTTDILRSAIVPLIPNYKRIILELSDLSHTDSMGLGTLVRLYISTKTDGCSLELMHLSGQIRNLLGLTNLFEVFTVIGEKGVKFL